MSSTSAPVLEVFASIQGEGVFVGEPQVFLRLRGCPLRCAWCDTPGSWRLTAEDTVRVASAEGPRRYPSWATPFQAACWIAEVEPREPRTVSVTGGEPLLWPGFIGALPKMLGGRRLHLETAGGHPRSLERVLEACDHVSLDLKLPSDMGPVEELPGDAALLEGSLPVDEPAPRDAEEWRKARRACLALIAGRDAAAKVVIAGERTARDFEPLLEDVARQAPDLPVILQPVTPMGGVEAPSLDLLEDVLEDARDLGLSVRIVPQVHRALRVP